MYKEVLREFFSTYGKEKLFWVSAFIEIFRTIVARVYAVILISKVVSYASIGNFEEAKHQVMLFLIWMTISAMVGSIGVYLGHYIDNTVYGRLCIKLYGALTNKDMSFYRNSSTGELTTIFRDYVDSGLLISRFVRGNIIRDIIVLTLPTIILFNASFKVGLFALLLVITQLVYIFWSTKKASPYREASHVVYRKTNGVVADDILNIVAFKSAGAESENQKKIVKLRKNEHELFMKRRKVEVLLDLPRVLITIFFMSLVFYSALNNNSQTLAVEILVLSITYMFQLFRNITDIPDHLIQFDDYVTRMYPTLSIKGDKFQKIKDPIMPEPVTSNDASISIRNLKFSYDDDDNKNAIFDDFNLEVESGEHVGIVGLSGGGKSTLASLIMRFDDISSGHIFIGGQDIKSVKQSDLRKSIAYVPQEPLLFHRSIRDNIAYNIFDKTNNDIIRVAKIAHADEFISRLTHKYDTVVGERGIKLSGGQKQRIAIARAILKDSKIILFDEATSALDSESETIIQNALPEILKNKTAIVIAHRLSTVAKLDRILVIHDGKIEEQGTHQQLLKLNGRYAKLWQKQTIKLK